MKVLALGLMILNLMLAQQVNCPAYVCGNLPNLECVQFKPELYSYVIHKCISEDNSYCPASIGENSVCQPQPLPIVESFYPGEKCRTDSDCLSMTCKKNKCEGLGEGKACKSQITQNSQCNPGLFCNLSKSPTPICEKLLKEHEPCSDDSQCIYGTSCFLSTTCQKLSSFKAGIEIPISSCIYNENKFCASQQCAISSNNSAFCIENLENPQKLPKPCSSINDCISKTSKTTGLSILSKCTCGANPKGQSYCELFNGDSYKRLFLSKVSKWIKSDDIKKCNIDRVWSKKCMNDHWDKENLDEYYYYQFMMKNFIYLHDAESCTIDVLFNDYKGLKDKYQDWQESSFGFNELRIIYFFVLIFNY